MFGCGLRSAGKALFIAFVIVACARSAAAQGTMPIGQIQGRGTESEYLERFVSFSGIVTGILEDENSRGTRFYTVYVQDLPGLEDGDPLTSDGLALFVGARWPSVAVGDVVRVHGRVTEFYGLTELDNNDLFISIESRNHPLPAPAEIDPPAENEESAGYLERYEAMRVSLPPSSVVGPAHVGCGFSVVRKDTGVERVLVREASDPAGQIIGVLHRSDVNCDSMPDVAHGDEVTGLVGPLTYHFDRFKIVYQDPVELSVMRQEQGSASEPPEVPSGSVVIATFNVNNYFDTQDDTGGTAEPKPSKVEVTLKTSKVAATISANLGCPELLGLQEVENRELLGRLVTRLSEPCGFEYEISHLESPDARGAEQALLSKPGRVEVRRISLRQACSEQDTGVFDSEAECRDGQQPLHSRPPLQVDVSIDGRRFVLLVNHLKSKREGAMETAPWRLAQAQHLNQIVRETQAADPDSHLIVLGDFNDYDGSEVMETLLAGTRLVDALAELPDVQRYSYIFDGSSQLIDWILISPTLSEFIIQASILHNNADFPFTLGDSGDSANLGFRSSDHDVPYVVLDFDPAAEPAPLPSTVRATSPPSPTTLALVERSATALPEATPISAAQNETRTTDELAEATEASVISETVEARSSSTPDTDNTGVIGAWIFALVAVAALVGALAIRRRG
ncbi:MAG: hypothetical protein JSW55_18985 [Chloroflexota bacterium]|nr:MAG: hypothetical protein JSW55_18985 [Chloroflexota bacterium]